MVLRKQPFGCCSQKNSQICADLVCANNGVFTNLNAEDVEVGNLTVLGDLTVVMSNPPLAGMMSAENTTVEESKWGGAITAPFFSVKPTTNDPPTYTDMNITGNVNIYDDGKNPVKRGGNLHVDDTIEATNLTVTNIDQGFIIQKYRGAVGGPPVDPSNVTVAIAGTSGTPVVTYSYLDSNFFWWGYQGSEQTNGGACLTITVTLFQDGTTQNIPKDSEGTYFLARQSLPYLECIDWPGLDFTGGDGPVAPPRMQQLDWTDSGSSIVYTCPLKLAFNNNWVSGGKLRFKLNFGWCSPGLQ